MQSKGICDHVNNCCAIILDSHASFWKIAITGEPNESSLKDFLILCVNNLNISLFGEIYATELPVKYLPL